MTRKLKIQRKGSSSWFATAWFTKGLNLPEDLTFIEINKCSSILTVETPKNARGFKNQKQVLK
jgi:hypothetical protein